MATVRWDLHEVTELTEVEQQRYNLFVSLIENTPDQGAMMNFFKPAALVQDKGTGHLEWDYNLGWDETLPPGIVRAIQVADTKRRNKSRDFGHKALCWLVVRSFELGL